MIGVAIREQEIDVCKEFFELFKTPWELYRPERSYDVVLCTVDITGEIDCRARFIYTSEEAAFDSRNGIRVAALAGEKTLHFKGALIPIYGNCSRLIQGAGSIGTPILEIRNNGRTIIRLGFDIFAEIRFLLTKGQPFENSLIPALDLHIEILRHYIIDSGAPLVEIPPIPAGYSSMACLTHDVDFIGIRQHFFDHTMFGFVYRAIIESIKNFRKRRISLASLLRNWTAVASLPLVYTRLIKDIWDDFDQYLDIEKGLGGTYFFMPFKNRPGKNVPGPHPYQRAAKYDLNEAKPIISKLTSNSCEIGVHGIDAWHDVGLAKKERERIAAYSKSSFMGTRIHWLCFSENSFGILDQAGFDYDSTFGYNEAIGFRAGTSQPFRPLGCNHLIEMPLIIQDTTLFHERQLHLSHSEAMHACSSILDHFARSGGALTILWHTRALSPERSLKVFYMDLLKTIREKGAWFANGHKITNWFRKRREVKFDTVVYSKEKIIIKVSNIDKNTQPTLLLRIHKKDWQSGKTAVIDTPIKSLVELAC